MVNNSHSSRLLLPKYKFWVENLQEIHHFQSLDSSALYSLPKINDWLEKRLSRISWKLMYSTPGIREPRLTFVLLTFWLLISQWYRIIQRCKYCSIKAKNIFQHTTISYKYSNENMHIISDNIKKKQ